MWGKTKEKKIQLRFIDTIRFMASSSDSLARNLAGGEWDDECRSEAELTHIDKNYIAGGAEVQELCIPFIVS